VKRRADTAEPSDFPIIVRAKPEKMVTLTCKNCRMALYMSDRVLHMPTWKCPSCGALTRPKVAAGLEPSGKTV
jgi:hypothetical protein